MPPLLCSQQTRKQSLKRNGIGNKGCFISHKDFCSQKRWMNTFSRCRRVPRYRTQPLEIAAGKSVEHQRLLQQLSSDLSPILPTPLSNAKDEKVGSRSLFSTCLAKVPEYIVEEQHQSEVHGHQIKVDSTLDIYSQLEHCFSSGPPGSGWEPLKEVIGYHIVQILSGSGVIGQSNADRLLDFCLHQDAKDELEVTCNSMVGGVNTRAANPRFHQGDVLRCNKNSPSYMRVLEHLAMQTGHYVCDYQRMAQLLEDNRYVQSKSRLPWHPSHFGTIQVLRIMFLLSAPCLCRNTPFQSSLTVLHHGL